MTLRTLSQSILLVSSLAVTTVIVADDNKVARNKQPSKTQQISPKTVKHNAQKRTEKTSKQVKDNSKKDSENATKKQTSSQNNTNSEKTSIIHIGSGAVGGNYFVLGELVGSVVSHPVGSLPCKEGGTCGVDGLLAVNLTSAGSVSNLNHLKNKISETAFVQSDIAYWAYTGTGLYENKEKMRNLRAIASLYPEAMHVVVRKDSQITDIAQLAGKRVSVGARKSGTIQSARLILSAYKLSEDDMKTEYLNNQQALKKLKDGKLDALFFTVGAPAPAFEQLFNNNEDYSLLPIGKAAQKEIFKQGHYFSPYMITANTYKGIPKVSTISVYALWLTTADADEQQVYELTKALWGETAKQIFQITHIGQQIDIENSLKGIGIPLHPGARKYYNEIGKRF